MVSGLAAPAASLAAAQAQAQVQGPSQARPTARACLRSSLTPASRRLGSSQALTQQKLALPWAAAPQPQGRTPSGAAVAMAADGDTPGQNPAPGGFPPSGPGSSSGGNSPNKNSSQRFVAAGAAPGSNNTMIRSDARHEKLLRMQKELLEQVRPAWTASCPTFFPSASCANEKAQGVSAGVCFRDIVLCSGRPQHT